MQEALESKLRGYVRTIKGRIADNFAEIDAMLVQEETQIFHLNQQHSALKQRLETLDKELEVN
jgi:hypothetical protein